MALGCKSLYKAAAAHVNNNAKALRCRKGREERKKSMDEWMKCKLRENITGKMRIRCDCQWEVGFDHAIDWLAEQNLFSYGDKAGVHGLISHQSFRQCVSIV